MTTSMLSSLAKLRRTIQTVADAHPQCVAPELRERIYTDRHAEFGLDDETQERLRTLRLNERDI